MKNTPEYLLYNYRGLKHAQLVHFFEAHVKWILQVTEQNPLPSQTPATKGRNADHLTYSQSCDHKLYIYS